MGRPSDIPWTEIQEAATNEALTVPEIAARFNVKPTTIRKRVERDKLVLVSSLIPKMQQRIAKQAAEKVAQRAADEWMERGEQHREVAFKVAHESLKKMKPKAPRNFREAEAADKIARRAAGLDVIDSVTQTLININEAMEAADEPRPIEAEVIESVPANQQSESATLQEPKPVVAELTN